jgi:hypothetical protein
MAMRGSRVWSWLGCGAALCATTVPARDTVAVFRDWGVFRDGGADRPDRCYAIAQPPPINDAASRGAFAAVSSFPAKRLRGQVSLRLSRGHGDGAPVTLSIGDAAFVLTGDGRTVWAKDRMEDALIVRAMRSGSSMSVATIGPHGGAYADVYRLRGAASAIDAAMLACAKR